MMNQSINQLIKSTRKGKKKNQTTTNNNNK